MNQRSRRRDPYPWTWEVPLVLVVATLILAVFGVHLGRAVANVLAGSDWRFPSRVDLFRSLPAVLRGDAGAGLVDLHGPGASPSSPTFWCCSVDPKMEPSIRRSPIWSGRSVSRGGPGRPGRWLAARSLATILRSCAPRRSANRERQALVLAENGKPIIARLARCIDGKAGRRLLADQRQLRTWQAERRLGLPTAEDRATAAVAEARNRGIATDQESYL
jgi:hypothetical protein